MVSNKVEEFEDSKYGKRHSHDPEFRGPMKNRSCTDIICLFLFIAFIAGWVVVGIYGFNNGNPQTLIYPSNSAGEICGNGNYSDKPYLLFFDLTKCISASVLVTGCPTPQVCVSSCPVDFGHPYHEELGETNQDKKKRMAPFCGPQFEESMIENEKVTANDLIEDKICPPWWVPSKPFLKRCIPFFVNDEKGDPMNNDTIVVDSEHTVDGATNVTGALLKEAVHQVAKLLDVRSFGEKVYADLTGSWWIILLGLLAATALAFLWIILMRFVAAVMVWSSLILSTLLLVVSCVYCYYKYDGLKDVPEASGTWFDDGLSTDLSSYTELSITWLVFFIISLILLVIVLILLLFLRTRIKIAVELIEEGSIAVGDMMSTLFFPVFPFLFELIVIGWFVLVAVFLGSSGEQHFVVNLEDCPNKRELRSSILDTGSQECINTDDGPVLPDDVTCQNATCEFFRFGNSDEANYLQIYNLFGLFWGLFFATAMEEMIMAGAFASWYFTMDKSKTPAAPLTASIYRTFRYHLGTLAFGSLIIAIIRMIRVLIEYIEDKLREYSQDNPLVKCLLCCCRCCFWCLESFMKFINRNAYIMTAIYGKNFCWSAKESFSLLMRNIARVFVLDKITDFLLLLGKLVIVASVAVGSFYVFSGRIDAVDPGDLNYYFIPVIIITIGAYFIADTFFDVYAMAVDTLFLCFLEDIERNDGSVQKPYYMSKDLRKILGYMENQSASPSKTPSPR